jgi:integrase
MIAELDMWLTRIAGSPCPFLIQHEGVRVFTFYKVWKAACEAAGVPNALFHDLRRTAVTDMIEGGLDEQEARAISGHKTASVFQRYNIISDRRLRTSGDKIAAQKAAKRTEAGDLMVRVTVRDAKTDVN